MRCSSNVLRGLRPHVGAIIVGAVLLPQTAVAEPLFKSLAGSWNGSGLMRIEGQKPERLKCRAYYTTKNGGAALGMTIRCANAANKIQLRAQLDSGKNGAVTGTWEENDHNVAGTVNGQADGKRMTLAISGNITGTMSVAFSGKTQTVTIATHGVALKGVSISLSRG